MANVSNAAVRHVSSWSVLCLLGLATFFLLPALGTGYWGEDVHHSVTVAGRKVLQGTTLVCEVLGHTKSLMLSGRFFPLTTVLISVVFYTIHDVVVYKAYLILAVVVDVLLFFLLVRKLSGRGGFACFAACLTVALLQFRVFVDPILSCSAQMQWVAAGIFFSLLSLQHYLDGRREIWLFASAVSYLIAALLYEMCYLMIALHLILIARAQPGRGDMLKAALPLLRVVGFCVLMTVLLRWMHRSDNYVHNVSFDAHRFWVTLARQTVAALPLSYFTADPSGVFAEVHDARSFLDWILDPRTAVVACAAMALSYSSLRGRESEGGVRPLSWPLFVNLGLLLAVLPAIPISISPYHQNNIFRLGVAWIPVLVQCFGVGLLLATALWIPLEKGLPGGAFARWKCLVASSAIAAIMGVTYRANCEVAVSLNAPPGTPHFVAYAAHNFATNHYKRSLLEGALDSGLLQDVPGQSLVQPTNEYPFWYDPTFSPLFFAKHTAKEFRIVPRGAPVPEPSGSQVTYRVRDVSMGRRGGFVVLSQFGPGGGDPGVVPSGRGLRLFVQLPGLFRNGPESPILVVGDPPGSTGAPADRRSVCLDRDLPLIRSGRNWGVFSLASVGDRIDPDTIRLQRSPSRETARRGPGDAGPLAVKGPVEVRK